MSKYMNTYARMRYGVHGVCWYLLHHLEQIHVCVCKCIYTYGRCGSWSHLNVYVRTHMECVRTCSIILSKYMRSV